MLSSTQSTDNGTLAPHLSHCAVIPHFTAIIPVRFEVGLIMPETDWITRAESGLSRASALNLLTKRSAQDDVGSRMDRARKREMRPLERADMAEDGM